MADSLRKIIGDSEPEFQSLEKNKSIRPSAGIVGERARQGASPRHAAAETCRSFGEWE